LHDFRPVIHCEVFSSLRRLPDKYSARDPMPTSLLKKCADLLCPYLTHLFNFSLSSGSFPTPWKKADISPILKKRSADPHDISSYRPVSKLPVLAKLLERIVSAQLQRHLNDNDLVPPQQSAYRPRFSCETALLKITADALSNLDKGDVCLLSFLDLTSAFDCVDHALITQRLRLSFGLRDSALNWFDSFLCNRSMRVSTYSSTTFVPVKSGVPQGSVLGPILFSLYISDVVSLVHRHGLEVHLFADDILIYGSSPSCNSSALSSQVSRCLESTDLYLKSLRLLLNPDKTKFMWCQSSRRHSIISSPILLNGVSFSPSSSVKYLGVILDSHLSFSSNVSLTSSSCFSMLRRIRAVRSSLTRPVLKSLVSSLVHSRLDYCISAHAGLPASTLWGLQRVLHASARLVTGAERHEHIRPLLRDLGWLSVRERIESRLMTLVFLCRGGLAPSYLSDELHEVASAPGRSRLRSATSGQICVPRVRRPTLGGRTFAATASRAWNRLPNEVTSSETEAIFKASVKSFFMNQM
jgi:hypothetical protein